MTDVLAEYAVVTCMDPRIQQRIQALADELGGAFRIQNAGAAGKMLNHELAQEHYVESLGTAVKYGAKTFIFIPHRSCGGYADASWEKVLSDLGDAIEVSRTHFPDVQIICYEAYPDENSEFGWELALLDLESLQLQGA